MDSEQEVFRVARFDYDYDYIPSETNYDWKALEKYSNKKKSTQNESNISVLLVKSII